MEGMLPPVDALFTLVRQLAHREAVTEVAAPKWLVQRHSLAPLAARAGNSEHRSDLIHAILHWARIENELPSVVVALTTAGVRVAPIKGVAYAKQLYVIPAERPMADVDLLVPPAHAPRARAVLTSLGFGPGPRTVLHHARAWAREGLVIDLHQSIIGPGRSHIDLDAVWSRTRAGWPHGAEFLDEVDTLVFHLVNLARNRLFAPLIHVVDTARMLNRRASIGDEALERARQWGVGSGVALCLRFAGSVLKSDKRHPAGWLGPSREEAAALEEPAAIRKLMFDALTAGSAQQFAARVASYIASAAMTRVSR